MILVIGFKNLNFDKTFAKYYFKNLYKLVKLSKVILILIKRLQNILKG